MIIGSYQPEQPVSSNRKKSMRRGDLYIAFLEDSFAIYRRQQNEENAVYII